MCHLHSSLEVWRKPRNQPIRHNGLRAIAIYRGDRPLTFADMRGHLRSLTCDLSGNSMRHLATEPLPADDDGAT